MKFLHTADWQIGMKADFVGASAQQVREERLATGRRVVDLAGEEGVEFILVAGDLFEDNAVDRILVQRTVDILSRFRGPVYLIPGNHDPLVPGSVWDHPAWGVSDNLVVLKESVPVEIPGGLLLPCPVLDKHARTDPTHWIEPEESGMIRIGVAHGNVEGLPQAADPDLPIPRGAPQRCGLDYLALGHWHSTSTYEDEAGIVRMAYSGTHETSRFGERNSGNVLFVEIQSPGDAPQVRASRTGKLVWKIVEKEVVSDGDLHQVRNELNAAEVPEQTLLDLRLKGLFFSNEKDELRHILDITEARFLFTRVDTTELIPSPQDTSWVEALPVGFLQETATRLQQQASSGGEHAETAALALLELYLTLGEVAR